MHAVKRFRKVVVSVNGEQAKVKEMPPFDEHGQCYNESEVLRAALRYGKDIGYSGKVTARMVNQ